jgi:hypothetical protein
MKRLSTVADCWLGLCPKLPVLRSAPAFLMTPPEMVRSSQPDGSGSAGSSGRIRHGMSIAVGSLKAMLRDKRLLWFTVMVGLVMLFLIAVEGWTITHLESAMPFLIGIPVGDSFLVVDTRLFLIQVVCLSCLTILLAGLVLYRNGHNTNQALTIREAFAGVSAHAGPLAVLSITMALAGTFLFEIVNQSQFFGKIILAISMAIFYLPYAYYLPDPISAAIFLSVIIMVVNIVLFLLALYVIPVIMLEKKGLGPALLGSVTLMRKTWREMLGCVLVFGVIVIGVTAVALVIGQSPLLLNHDYDFFISLSRGQLLMMAICSLFILTCWIILAIGSTAVGIAVLNLYTYGKTGRTPEIQ